MKYKWISLLTICFLLLTGCQSVSDFFKSGDKTQEQTSESDKAQVASSAEDVLNRLPEAKTVAEHLEILQEAYTVALTEEDADQTAFILQSLQADISSLHMSINPDYQHCEFGDSFNILVTVQSDSGIPAGSVPISVLLEDGTLFDTLETGPDGVFFGEFRCGIASGTGEKQYCFKLSLDETSAKDVGIEIPHADLILDVEKMSVTADLKVDEELFSDSLASLYRNFLDQQLQLNLVVPKTKEKFHVQLEIFTTEILHDYQGYSADVSLAFYIAGDDGVVIYDMETNSCHAVGNTASGMVESGVSQLFDAIRQDTSFISDFQSALFKE